MQAPQPHFVRHEELVLGRRLGAGSFGEVYHATWRGTNVAVKRLLVNVVNAELKAAFLHEASVLFQVRHPRVVLLMGYTDPNALQGAPCLVFEFVEGGTLFTALHEEKRPIDERQVAIDVAEGLGFLHSSKPAILHRDLKSLNILLDREGKHAKLCDLGLARVKAPEVMNDEPYGSPADVYSFGLVLYELVSKEIPFKDKSPVQLVRLVVDQQKRPDLPASTPAEWRSIVESCWQQQPAQRPIMSNVIALVKALPGLSRAPVAASPQKQLQAAPPLVQQLPVHVLTPVQLMSAPAPPGPPKLPPKPGAAPTPPAAPVTTAPSANAAAPKTAVAEVEKILASLAKLNDINRAEQEIAKDTRNVVQEIKVYTQMLAAAAWREEKGQQLEAAASKLVLAIKSVLVAKKSNADVTKAQGELAELVNEVRALAQATIA